MSLQLALNTALTSLQVNQRVLSVISNNIANANTEGYSRQVVDLSSLTLDGTGYGVRIEDVTRKIDEYLKRAINEQTSTVGQSEAISDYYERMQIMLGEPGSQNSIDEYISTFFDALQVMADSPERTSSRASAVDAGVALAGELSSLAYGLHDLRYQADQEIAQGVNIINAQLRQLTTINEAIANARSLGNSTATLEDQRDMAVNTIAKYINLNVYQRPTGEIHLYTGNGQVLLDDSFHEVVYTKTNSIESLIADNPLAALEIFEVDSRGNRIGTSNILATSATSDQVTSTLRGGSLLGLLQMRDQLVPNMLAQMDNLAATIRDEFNAIHNKGSGYPPASSLTASREVRASERMTWLGQTRIVVMNEDGTPVESPFDSETSGVRPLLLDFPSLNSGFANGEVTTQTIIDEINNHFGIPNAKVSLGNFNSIELAAISNNISPIHNVFQFDLDIENISGGAGQLWVEGITVRDDTGTDISNVTNTLPSLNLDNSATFTTTTGSNSVRVTTAGVHGLAVGDRVRLHNPGAAVNGIPATEFDDYFVITAVNGNTFDVTLGSPATSTGSVGLLNQTTEPAYATIDPGSKTRTGGNGSITANMNLNAGSEFYDIAMTMVNFDAEGNQTRSTVTYRVHNTQYDIRGSRYAPVLATNDGVLEYPNNTSSLLRAVMVDENGVELPNNEGHYGDQTGFLKIVAARSGITVAIDSLNSRQRGLESENPPIPGTNRAFSHFFELNNFFASNQPTLQGDTLENAALYMDVVSRLKTNPSLMSTGSLERSNQSADPDDDPIYTYERYSGNHKIAQELAGLAERSINFAAVGGLPSSSQGFISYGAEMLGYMSSLTVAASSALRDDRILMDGFVARNDSVSGVNLDEELANTIIYQNAYAASARVISITNELYDTLLQI
jgi:flagellar hook-associated protein 1